MIDDPNGPANEQTAPAQPPKSAVLIDTEPPKPAVVNINSEVINIEAKQATIHAQQTSGKEQDPETLLGDRIKKSDRLMIVLTAIIAISGLLTWMEVHNAGIVTSAQTDRIIEADDSLANATEAN